MHQLPVAFAVVVAVVAVDEMAFHIASRRANDVVTVTSTKDAAVFDVTSPFGISQTTIARKADAWPKVVVVRLRLKGLENFKISSGKAEAEGAVKIKNGKPDVRMWVGDDESPLDAASPMWVKVAIVGEETPTIPLKTGAFELTLPPALFEGNPKAISVRWIDFYR